MTDTRTIAERINQRRRQVMIHSVLYYRMDASYIPDHQFDYWVRELVELQDAHPEIAESVPYCLEAFRGYEGISGFDLPLYDAWANRQALWLLRERERERLLAVSTSTTDS